MVRHLGAFSRSTRIGSVRFRTRSRDRARSRIRFGVSRTVRVLRPSLLHSNRHNHPPLTFGETAVVTPPGAGGPGGFRRITNGNQLCPSVGRSPGGHPRTRQPGKPNPTGPASVQDTLVPLKGASECGVKHRCFGGVGLASKPETSRGIRPMMIQSAARTLAMAKATINKTCAERPGRGWPRHARAGGAIPAKPGIRSPERTRADGHAAGSGQRRHPLPAAPFAAAGMGTHHRQPPYVDERVG